MVQSYSKRSCSLKILKLSFLPIVIYFSFILLRLLGVQPEAESELGDYITSINFIFGGSIAYLMHILIVQEYFSVSAKIDKYFWPAISFWMFFLAFDEVFMIHENIHEYTSVRDAVVFLIYGLILILTLILAYPYYTKSFFVFIVMFGFCAIVSIVSDYFLSEGVVMIKGNSISYEQFSESFGALFLSSSIVCLIVSFLRKNSLSFNKN